MDDYDSDQKLHISNELLEYECINYFIKYGIFTKTGFISKNFKLIKDVKENIFDYFIKHNDLEGICMKGIGSSMKSNLIMVIRYIEENKHLYIENESSKKIKKTGPDYDPQLGGGKSVLEIIEDENSKKELLNVLSKKGYL